MGGTSRSRPVSRSILDGGTVLLAFGGYSRRNPTGNSILLDIYWGVGRLSFDEIDSYKSYARSVVGGYEQGLTRAKRPDSAIVFATAHEFDKQRKC